MQAIPDKDFNQSFQQKFEMFEVEPSSAIWEKVVSELDRGKKKEGAFPLMQIMAAATLLLVLGSGLFLLSPKDRVRLQGKADEAIAAQQEIQSDPANIPALPKTVKNTKIQNHPVVNSLQAEANPALRPSSYMQTVAVVQEAPKTSENKAVARDMELTKQDNQYLKENKEVMTTANRPVALGFANDQISMPDTGRYLTSQKRSRNGAGLLGSVVNYVVGKVDPREDKLIKFSNDEDGGSEISGINLGVLKMKKQNR